MRLKIQNMVVSKRRNKFNDPCVEDSEYEDCSFTTHGKYPFEDVIIRHQAGIVYENPDRKSTGEPRRGIIYCADFSMVALARVVVGNGAEIHSVPPTLLDLDLVDGNPLKKLRV